MENTVKVVESAIQNCKRTHNGLYCDIELALEAFSTKELAEFYIAKYGQSTIRYYLEQGIIAGEINRIKYEKGV